MWHRLLLSSFLFFRGYGQTLPSPEHDQKASIIVPCPSDAQRCVILGTSFSLTGRYSRSGKSARRGLLLFAELANGAAESRAVATSVFKENGKSKFISESDADQQLVNFEIRAFDDQSNETRVEAAFKALVDEVDLLIGPYGSTFGKIAAGVAQSAKRVIVLPMSAADYVYPEVDTHVVGLFTPTSRYTHSFIQELAVLGAKTAVLLHSSNGFATSLSKATKQWLRGSGMELVGEKTYDSDSPWPHSLVASHLQQLCGMNADVLFVHGLKYEGTWLAEAAQNSSCRPKALMLTTASSDDSWVAENAELAGDLCLLGTAQWRPHEKYADPFFGNADTFRALHEGRFKVPPGYEAAATAASALLLLQVMTASTTVLAEGQSLRSTAVQQLLLTALLNFEGLSFFGPIRFDERGRNVGKPMMVTQVFFEKGIHIVGPTSQQEQPMRYPCNSLPVPSPTKQPVSEVSKAIGAAKRASFGMIISFMLLFLRYG